ncbi:MAG: molybdenum ABC transporter ATP-binding protein [Proteobacteria bacterium]|nr:molybdenum ABC transporter ATP-binding protein [Pseudomonadota bacterium]
MTLLVSARKARGSFVLDAAFEAPLPGVVALFGRSGSGKTTLVNIISGLLPADAARISLNGETLTDTTTGVDVPVELRRIGYVFQDGRVFPHLSVAANLRYGEKRTRAAAFVRFDDVVALLGLGALLARRPHQLSGGERQRVALGRALLAQPRLLLLDEPMTSLDGARREEVLPYLTALRDSLAVPMVYVSHQYDEVLRLASHIVLMEGGQVLAHGPVSDVSLHPRLAGVVGLDESGAVIETTVKGLDGNGAAEVAVGNTVLRTTLRGCRVGSRVRLQVPARDVILSTRPVEGVSVRNVLAGTVVDLVDQEDGEVLVRLDLGGAPLLARITREAREALALGPGVRAWALVKTVATRGHVY